jgi:hypothetical protein
MSSIKGRFDITAIPEIQPVDAWVTGLQDIDYNVVIEGRQRIAGQITMPDS